MKGYICPTCLKKFTTESDIKKHSLTCWKELHPNHIVKHASQGKTKNTKEINDDILSFFNSFNKGG